MNTTQIKCFLALSETLNFTKAAARLYLSQPALSRQIATLEQELNTLLLIRDSKNVRLTPAGALLAEELSGLNTALEDLISRTKAMGMGYSGSLTIGVLEGQWLGDTFSQLCRAFIKQYSGIDFHLQQGSFSQLRQQLNDGKIDAAITLEFDIRDMSGVVWQVFEPDSAVFAASSSLPICRRKKVTLEALMAETLLLISPEDSKTGHDSLLSDLKNRGYHPRSVRLAPNFSTLTLWIEAGLGVGVVNHFSALTKNPTIRLLTEIPLGDASPCIVWRRDNLNPSIALFAEMVKAWGLKQ